MKFPTIIDINKDINTPNQIDIKLDIAPEIIYFAGHFENHPVLPGVVQLDWALHFAKSYLNINKTNFAHIEQMKFSKIITPNIKIFLHLSLEENKLKFKFYNENTIYSIGKLKAKIKSNLKSNN